MLKGSEVSLNFGRLEVPPMKASTSWQGIDLCHVCTWDIFAALFEVLALPHTVLEPILGLAIFALTGDSRLKLCPGSLSENGSV